MRRLAALVLAGALGACAAKPPVTSVASIDADAPKVERDGLELEAERLLAADRALSRESAELGAAKAFEHFFDDAGLQLPLTGTPAVGPLQAAARAPAGVLSRAPRHAEVFADGDWGWTWGDWQLHEPGAGGRRLAQGRYVNVWRKQRDGSWKVRADLGSAER